MAFDLSSKVITPRSSVAFLLATAISLMIGLSHLYAEFKPKTPIHNEYEQFLKQPIDAAGGSTSYEGIMECLRLTLGMFFVAIGIVNLIALREAAPGLRKRASLVYCVAFACLSVQYRSNDLLFPGMCLGIAAICYLTDAVFTPRSMDRIQ